jgi:site-specific DNA-methyltransferase (adenine-specific)
VSKYTLVPAAEIVVPPDRQRTSYPKEHINELAKSIATDCLIHAPTVTSDFNLVAGFCRREAILLLGQAYQYGGETIPAGFVPVIVVTGKSELELARIELEENLRRKSLSPVEEAQAIAKLHRMLDAVAASQGMPHTKAETALALAEMRGEQINWDQPPNSKEVSDNLIIEALADDPDVQKAKTRNEALKIAKKKMEAMFAQGLGSVSTVVRDDFKLLEGSCHELFPTLAAETFAGIISDPPYGVGADSFGDQAFHAGHSYSDNIADALAVADLIFHEGFRVCKAGAHLYMFCDIRVWPELTKRATLRGWQVYSTPIIWHKPNAGHAPQPGFFTRRYETILFCRKGERKLVTSASDVMSFASVTDKMYAAEKPQELLMHLMKLSFLPGETILDPTCGSGSIFPAAKAVGLRAVGIEVLPEAINLSKKRIGEL